MEMSTSLRPGRGGAAGDFGQLPGTRLGVAMERSAATWEDPLFGWGKPGKFMGKWWKFMGKWWENGYKWRFSPWQMGTELGQLADQ